MTRVRAREHLNKARDSLLKAKMLTLTLAADCLYLTKKLEKCTSPVSRMINEIFHLLETSTLYLMKKLLCNLTLIRLDYHIYMVRLSIAWQEF